MEKNELYKADLLMFASHMKSDDWVSSLSEKTNDPVERPKILKVMTGKRKRVLLISCLRLWVSSVCHSFLFNFVRFSREIDVILSGYCDENNQNISSIQASMSLQKNAHGQCYHNHKHYQNRQMSFLVV